MKHSSRGYLHHADSTTECPGCGRRHRTGTTVTERPDGNFEVTFRSKQTGRWGRIVVPAEAVEWSDRHPMTAPEPEPADDTITALVTVDERGRLTPESTVTVGEWSWPVPETYGTVIWLHRVGRTLRDNGWSVTGEPRPGAETGVYEVPVRKIETNET